MKIKFENSNSTHKELSRRQFQAKLRNRLLHAIEQHQISEFERLLKEGHIKKDKKDNDQKIWFPERKEI